MSPAVSNAIEAPNLFTLAGRHVSVSVALSGIDGKPHVTFHDAQHVLSFSGDEITMEDSALGRLITVVVARTVDLGSSTFTVVLPAVNLISGHHHVDTIGVTALHRTSIAGVGRGQLTTYTTARLRGTAEQVQF